MTQLNIKAINTQGNFGDVTAGRADHIVRIAHALRTLLADVMPGITEVSWPKQQIAGYGIGPKKMSEQFCYIAPVTNHVNLGFIYGVDLDDPAGLMEGTGKALRHIKIRSLEQVSDPDIRTLVIKASKHLPKLK